MIAVLVDEKGATVYKILSQQPKGFEETKFYELAFSDDASHHLQPLRPFLPAYRGLFQQVSTQSKMHFVFMHVSIKSIRNSYKGSNGAWNLSKRPSTLCLNTWNADTTRPDRINSEGCQTLNRFPKC